ncbi:hypothetical protein FA13DRAFT_1731590 [Coprinellus micaceus]|uniref:Uncharacterized protein n=1 Tax=Coprinellus micaceus TaxID=71717 RepID=A0A4Y7TDZ2_COPMI|nr:hypothetical protein FA13DRAFT_1731590 [Coprinellus micaceus]
MVRMWDCEPRGSQFPQQAAHSASRVLRTERSIAKLVWATGPCVMINEKCSMQSYSGPGGEKKAGGNVPV